MKREEKTFSGGGDEWTLLVDAPLSNDILDHSGNGNHPIQQSYTPTFNDNALYITGVNRGITLNCVDFTQIWQEFKMEMDVKWASQKNCGLWMLGGSWANARNMIGVIKDSGQSYLSFWQYAASQQSWSLTLWPANVWIKFSMTVKDGYIDITVKRLDNDTILTSLHLTQTQTGGYANSTLKIGGSFSYNQYWNGWIRNFKLYKA